MSQSISSVDTFLGMDEEVDTDQNSNAESNEAVERLDVLDSRRRLENKMAERQLAKDIQEFDFDF